MGEKKEQSPELLRSAVIDRLVAFAATGGEVRLFGNGPGVRSGWRIEIKTQFDNELRIEKRVIELAGDDLFKVVATALDAHALLEGARRG